jgi:hypothetical protein
MQLFPWNMNFRTTSGFLLAARSEDSEGDGGEARKGVLSNLSRAVYVEDEQSEAGSYFEHLSFSQRVL